MPLANRWDRRSALLLLGLVVLLPGSAWAEDAYRIERVIDAPPNRVWQALVEKAWVDRYYFVPLGADIEAVGRELTYGTADQTLILGRVLRLEPERVLEHSFRFAHEDPAVRTTVTYRLQHAVAAQTRLELEHRGYPPESQSYADIAGGWPIILDGLKRVVESDTAP